MPEDDTLEPLVATIDLAAIALEALALAVPDYPRSAGVAEVDLTVTEPGVVPLTDDAARPFAGLAALKSRMGDGDGPEE